MAHDSVRHPGAPGGNTPERHPPGLYVLFATEMWERFSFYTMGAMFTLYMRDATEGFGWTASQATILYSNYAMFVYASPLVGGFLASWKIGYRNAVMVGGFFFMAGHLLLAFPSLPVLYAALTCLIIGNGFFKPNISAMVGNLYPPGHPLKERAYSIFYMGINVGAMTAPIVAEYVKSWFGFHVAFAVAAVGMVISVAILAIYRRHVEDPDRVKLAALAMPTDDSELALAEDLAPAPVKPPHPIELVPPSQRICALLVVFVIVIVFWMVFHQNHVTLTYWANENTDWEVTGIIATAINGFFVVTLTIPLIGFWRFLNRYGWEPSTPTKMAIGMVLTGCAFLILVLAAQTGERDALVNYESGYEYLESADGSWSVVWRDHRYAYRLSPWWLIGTYFVLTLAELMLSPMGLALVAKVAPTKYLGIMMGGWFVATAIGNKLTMIGVLWDRWLHSEFFLLLACMALAVAVLLFCLLRPLKKAMPGV